MHFVASSNNVLIPVKGTLSNLRTRGNARKSHGKLKWPSFFLFDMHAVDKVKFNGYFST